VDNFVENPASIFEPPFKISGRLAKANRVCGKAPEKILKKNF
jgi:hypothetical protein